MNSSLPEPLHSCHAALSTEYTEALEMVKRGRVIPLNDQLRRSLARVSDEIQGAIDDGAEVTEADLAMLCAAEVKALLETKTADYMHLHYRRNLYARTLFEYSRGVLVGSSVKN